VKRLLAVVLLVGVAVSVGVLTASGSSSSAAQSAAPAAKKSVTLHLVEKSVGFNFIDNPPRQGFDSPPLMGDQFAISSNLQTKSGTHVGTLEATCMVTRGGERTRGICTGVFAFIGGQVALTALLPNTDTTEIAVVGGTGAYEGVTGSVVSVGRGDNSPYSDDTIHLIWP